MTDGKYAALELDNKMSFGFESDFGIKNAEHLSAGTREGLYLCLRLALLRLIYGDEMPPIILDDAFARMDGDRLAAFMKLLASDGNQCLIFACTGREKEALRAVGAEYSTIKIN